MGWALVDIFVRSKVEDLVRSGWHYGFVSFLFPLLFFSFFAAIMEADRVFSKGKVVWTPLAYMIVGFDVLVLPLKLWIR